MDWFKEETERLSRLSQKVAEQIVGESERTQYEAEARMALSELTSANHRFASAVMFGVAASLFMLITGFREATACATLLLFAPGLASSLRSDRESVRRAPLPELEKRARSRDTFASCAWAIATGAVLAGVFLHWGELGGSPESPW